MKLHFILHILAKEVYLRTKQRFQLGKGMNVQRGSMPAPQHAQSGNEPYQPEAMIAVQMTDKDMSEPSKSLPTISHLKLSALAAVNHKLLPAPKDELRR